MTYASGKVSKLEYAKYFAASLAYMVLKQRESVGLSVFDSKVRAYFPPRSSMGIILEIDRLLRGTDPTPKSSIAQQLYDITLLMKRRSVVILISDLFLRVFNCPRCERAFFGAFPLAGVIGRVLTKRCVHCSPRKFASGDVESWHS